jgi:hypothetical protein
VRRLGRGNDPVGGNTPVAYGLESGVVLVGRVSVLGGGRALLRLGMAVEGCRAVAEALSLLVIDGFNIGIDPGLLALVPLLDCPGDETIGIALLLPLG